LDDNPFNKEFSEMTKQSDVLKILKKNWMKKENERKIKFDYIEDLKKEKYPIIDHLIQEMKFSEAIRDLIDLKKTAEINHLKEIINWADEKLDSCNKLEKTKSVKKKFPMIEKLIREMKFVNAIEELKNIRKIAKKNNLDEILSWAKGNLILCNTQIIKKTVLKLGIKFARLQIAEISEVCGVDDLQLIVDTVKDMIENREIYAQYFSSTKSVAFDQQANIDEIDKLMSTYKDWEDEKIGKK